MFFSEANNILKKEARIRQPPPIPDNGWQCPKEPPNLSNAVAIAFDVETRERDLDNGPGWARDLSYVCGLALAAQDRSGASAAWYFPIRHAFDPTENLDPARVLPWASKVLDTPNVDKIGHNLTYDIGTLNAEGVKVSGDLYDTMYAQALIDPDSRLSLNNIARIYENDTKVETEMYQWLADAYGGAANRKNQASNIYRAPAKLVAPYAISDVELPLKIIKKQVKILIKDKLWPVYRLECDLIYLMIAMRFAGVRVDIERAQNLKTELKGEIELTKQNISQTYGHELKGVATSQLIPLFEKAEIKLPTNSNGNLYADKNVLSNIDHPLAQQILDLREKEKLISTFIDAYIIGQNIKGKLHPEFNQLRSEDGGTIVGRFSSSNPNLQNIPSRTKLGKRIRECFIPDDNCVEWRKYDFSQIHYRLLAHYAVDDGDGSADQLRLNYIQNPQADYHQTVLENVAPFMGWNINDKEHNAFVRRPIKNVNFGLLYGQSLKSLLLKTAAYFGSGFTKQQGQQFIDAYFKGAPYVKPTMALIANEVQTYGYIRTILGRRVYFNLWEPVNRKKGEFYQALPYDEALQAYGWPLRRAFDYRGVNYKFQGSEPDIMKTGMLNCWKAGIFDVTGVPRATVHDELNFSVPNLSKEVVEAYDEMQRILETSVPLRVPVFVDCSIGPNWGKAD